MSSFKHARKQHLAVRRAAEHDEHEACALWDAVRGVGEPLPGSYADAVLFTAPPDLMGLVASDDTIAAAAFGVLWQGLQDRASAFDRASAVGRRDMAREVWAQFAEVAQQAQELVTGFGWDLSSAWACTIELQQKRVTLAQVERIAKLAGRMYGALRGASARRVNGMPGEVHSVEQGAAIDRLLPSEQVLLTDSALEAPVLYRISQRRALQYAVRGDAKKSRGPLVVAIDESGSMEGHRNEWAKAAAVAVARVAEEDKRPVAIVHFSTSVRHQGIRTRNQEDVLVMISTFLNGGTAIGLALECAVQQVKDLAAKGRSGADIILITDGVDGNVAAHDHAISQAHEIGARLWTIGIQVEIPEHFALRARAENYVHLPADELDAGAVKLFAGAV